MSTKNYQLQTISINNRTMTKNIFRQLRRFSNFEIDCMFASNFYTAFLLGCVRYPELVPIDERADYRGHLLIDHDYRLWQRKIDCHVIREWYKCQEEHMDGYEKELLDVFPQIYLNS